MQRTHGAGIGSLPGVTGTMEFIGTFKAKKWDIPRQTRTIGQPTQCLEGTKSIFHAGTQETEAGGGAGKTLSLGKGEDKTVW